MSESFVPLVPANSKSPDAAFASFNLKQPAGGAKSAADARAGKPGEACAKPSVTLQRNGDIVTGIRIQCTCGQVVELNCVY